MGVISKIHDNLINDTFSINSGFELDLDGANKVLSGEYNEIASVENWMDISVCQHMKYVPKTLTV